MCRKISASVDGGPSEGSRVRRPGSEDPHQRQRKLKLFLGPLYSVVLISVLPGTPWYGHGSDNDMVNGHVSSKFGAVEATIRMKIGQVERILTSTIVMLGFLVRSSHAQFGKKMYYYDLNILQSI